MIINKSVLRVGDIIVFQTNDEKFFRLILEINNHEIKVFLAEGKVISISKYSNNYNYIFNNPKYYILNNK